MKTIPFLLTILAGLSTLIGIVFIYIKIDIKKFTNIALAFAAGVMISLSIIELIPESIKECIKNNNYNKSFIITTTFIIIGLLSAHTINIIINQKNNKTKIYKIGILSTIAMILHNIPEGIITYISSVNNLQIGIMLTIAIALHNIPEGISISIPIYSSTKNKNKALYFTFLSALAEPLGAIIGQLYINHINNTILGILLALTAGIMIYIGIFKLIPITKENKKFIIIGAIIMFVSNIIIN